MEKNLTRKEGQPKNSLKDVKRENLRVKKAIEMSRM